MPPNEAPPSLTRAAAVFRFGETARQAARAVPVETPVNIVYGSMPWAVMMATPADLEDFAAGFSLTEGVIGSAGDIRGIETVSEERGLRLNITLSAERMKNLLARSRNMAGRTGCGLCGIDDLSALPAAKITAREKPPLLLSAARRAIAGLGAHQPLNAETHAVHAAAWCDRQGNIVCAREDVGRHNALDKLIGALARAGTDPASGFVLITSRCSFEMVEKAAVFGARAVVAVSAPTSLAIERARAHGMTLLAVARSDGAVCFAGAEQIVDDLAPSERLRA